MKGKLCLVPAIVLLSLISGCVSQKPLEGTVWNLDSYVNREGTMVRVLPDIEVTAIFEDGMVGGDAGCNRYRAEYKIYGNAITIGLIIQTLMFCYPEEVMEQESDYFAALESVESYKIKGNKLEMTNASGKIVLVFTAA